MSRIVTKRIIKSSASGKKRYQGDPRFEHWYVDNQVYFITARCREGYAAFYGDQAKRAFWDRFDNYTSEYRFTPWVTSLLSNHYHTLGYARDGTSLGQMMRRLHGSVAKLVNDLLAERRVPFRSEPGHQDYFDGCIRDEKQCRLAYRYILSQSVRHGLCKDWRDCANTRMSIELDRGVKRALELCAFMEEVPYKRYLDMRRSRRSSRRGNG